MDDFMKATTSREEAIRSLLNDGLNLTEIAEALGVSRQAVHQFCTRRQMLPEPEKRVGGRGPGLKPTLARRYQRA